MSIKNKGIQRPTSRVEIRFENAINYIPDLDRPYFVTDSKQSHLKLRVMQQGSKTFFYDYMWNGKRCRQRLGTLSDNNKDGITPSEARKLVGEYEAKRKGMPPRHPLSEEAPDVKAITLNSHFEVWKEDAEIKPRTTKNGMQMGMLPLVFKQQVDRYNRHIRDLKICDECGTPYKHPPEEGKYCPRKNCESKKSTIKKNIGGMALTKLTVKEIKDWFDEEWDHRVLLAYDDPLLNEFKYLADLGGIDINILPKKYGPGIEQSCKYVFDETTPIIKRLTSNRVWISKVKIFEHENNWAEYNVKNK